MLDITTDFNEYPHRIFASVVLLDNKIMNWKIVNYRWTKKNMGDSKQQLIIYDYLDKITVRSRSFIAHSPKEHSKIFKVKARKFFKQFEIHEWFRGMKPY